MQSLSIKTAHFIRLYKTIKNHVKSYMLIYFVFGTWSNIYGGAFLRKKLTAKCR